MKNVGGLSFYASADVHVLRVAIGGHVAVQPAEEGLPMFLAEVVSMWEQDKTGKKVFHAQ